MVFNKAEHDQNVRIMISNLIHDEKSYILDAKPRYHSWHEVFGVMHEEYLETLKEIENLKDDYAELEARMMGDVHEAHMIDILLNMKTTAQKLIHEAVQVAAVASKAIEQSNMYEK